MADIVERLRALDAWAFADVTEVMHAGADEIEKLREVCATAVAASNRANDRATALQMHVYHLEAERDRLREALREIADDGTTDVLVDEVDGRLWTVRQTEAARIAMRALKEMGHDRHRGAAA